MPDENEKTDGREISLDDLEALFDVPFVFWMCPNPHVRGFVQWNDDCTVATCQTCGNTSDRGYPEDVADENGSYYNRCLACGHHFIGYKRRVVCKKCASTH